jgi:hypothetical protein
MEVSLTNAIIQVLSYFDIFEYPLTFSEIKKYLEKKTIVSDDEIYAEIESISSIQELDGYYYFLGRRANVQKRVERAGISIEKMAKARVIANILSKIPTIQYIGISGSLSMNNSVENDDIDLFFITRRNTLWMSRFLVNFLLSLTHQKRKRNEKEAKNKICPNMFMDEGELTLDKKRRNLYIAHEIIQLKTVFDRNEFSNLLLSENRWIGNFLPNITIPTFKNKRLNKSNSVLKLINFLFFSIQNLYITKHKTRETVEAKLAMFHPLNREKVIKDLYKLKSKRYKELYAKNQWIDRDEARFYFDENKIRILN